MIEVKQGLFYINGKPKYLFAGEIHYFRLPTHLWKIHIEKLIESGCQVVSFYIPWLIHEPQEDVYEFQGESLEQYDLIRFIQLCISYDLYIFLRPGPFVMAELLHEGIPPYLFQVEDIKPRTFHKKRVPNDQIDYLHPYFLERTRKYMDALFNALKPYTQEGGPVIGVQLDNEIGMLAWVSQSPALTEDVIEHLGDTFDQTQYVFKPGQSARGHQRLGIYMRHRFKRFVDILDTMIKQLTHKNMLTFINVHGTEGGRGKSFPIGYSQLKDTFGQRIIGTDIYFSHLTIENTHDYYIINSMLQALKLPETPSTSLEFNAGNSNFGDDLSGHDTPQSMDKKIRMNMIQGHQMINYYLLSAGMNPRIPHHQNPFQRIAFTGERHGFSAPIQIQGNTTYMYDQIKSTNQLFLTHEPFSIHTQEVTSTLTFGFILDQYMTESMRHGTEIEDIKVALTRARSGIVWDQFLKHSLLLQRPFRSLHLENSGVIDVSQTPVLAVPISTYMSASIQETLIQYIQSGGKCLFFGQCPLYDLEGQPNQSLMQFLNIDVEPFTHEQHERPLSACYDLGIDGYPSFRTPYYQVLHHNMPSWFETESHEKLSYISDQVILVTTPYPGHLEITERFLQHVHIDPIVSLKHQGYLHAFQTRGDHGGYLHLLNIEGFKQTIKIDHPLLDTITLMPFESLMLFDQLRIHGHVVSSSVECIEIETHQLTFKTDGREADVYIQTNSDIENPLCVLKGDTYHCHIGRHKEDTWTIKLEAN